MRFRHLVGLGMLCFSAPGFTAAESPDCITGPDNLITVGDCLARQLNRADVDLNEAYQKILAMLSDGGKQRSDLTETRQALVEAQRAWIAFRDSDCLAVEAVMPGDPALESRNTLCLLTRTQQRIKQLNEWMGYPALAAAGRNDAMFMASDAPIAGQPLDHWLQAYWQWSRSFTPDKPPSGDSTGSLCAIRQNQPVFFLTGSNDGLPVMRRCRIPRNKPLLIPVLNSLAQNVDRRPDVCPGLVASVQKANRQAEGLFVSVDDTPVPVSRIQEVESGCFSLDDTVDEVHGMAAGAGHWVVLAPLPPGQHTVKFSGTYAHDGFSQNVEYRLTVE
jgi:uncharacterized protein YecT (DUF1311 family)